MGPFVRTRIIKPAVSTTKVAKRSLNTILRPYHQKRQSRTHTMKRLAIPYRIRAVEYKRDYLREKQSRFIYNINGHVDRVSCSGIDVYSTPAHRRIRGIHSLHAINTLKCGREGRHRRRWGCVRPCDWHLALPASTSAEEAAHTT